MATEFNKSGSKYLRPIKGAVDGKLDVYAVIKTFDVKCPARQHAIKKLLCSGLRGKGDCVQDLREAGDAIARAVQLETESDSTVVDKEVMGLGFVKELVVGPQPDQLPLRPSDVLVREYEREKPFASMFGCTEKETLAEIALRRMQQRGNLWSIPIYANDFKELKNADWLLDHSHGDGTVCKFMEDFFKDNIATQLFIDMCRRKGKDASNAESDQ